jgi:signal transduction histidine kinase
MHAEESLTDVITPTSEAENCLRRGAEEVKRGQFSAALGPLDKAVADLSAEVESQESFFEALRLLGYAHYRLGNQEAALAVFERGATTASAAGNAAMEGRFRNNMGNVYATRRDFRAALEAFRESLLTARKLGDREAEAKALGNLGSIHYHLEQREEAAALQEETLALARELGLDELVANTLCNLSQVLPKGEKERAVELISEARALNQRIGRHASALEAAVQEAEAYWELGRQIESQELVTASLADPLIAEIPVAQARFFLLRALQREAVGLLESALRDLEAAESIAHKAKLESTRNHVLFARLNFLRTAGRHAEALEAFDQFHRNHCEDLEARASEALSRQRAGFEVEQARARVQLQEQQSATLMALHEEALAQNASLRRLNLQLERLLAERSEMTAVLAHDLSNPLFALENGILLLRDDLPDKTQEFAGSLGKVARDASRIVRQLLDRGRVEVVFEDLGKGAAALVDCVRESIARHQTQVPADRAGFHFVPDRQLARMKIEAPTSTVERIIDNLLSNAVRYGLSDRPVEVTLEAVGKVVRLSVRDFGPGLSEELRYRLFHAPVEPSAEVSGSSGMGLALTAKIVARLGGSLRCEPVEGAGACFVCLLPTL